MNGTWKARKESLGFNVQILSGKGNTESRLGLCIISRYKLFIRVKQKRIVPFSFVERVVSLYKGFFTMSICRKTYFFAGVERPLPGILLRVFCNSGRKEKPCKALR